MEPIMTGRLVIRSFLPTDGQSLYEYLSDPEVVRYEPYAPFTREQAEAEAVRRAGDTAFLAVCCRETGALMGNLYFALGEFDTWELGYVFGRPWQGKGYATEAARAIVDYGFACRNAHRVVAMCNPENTASWRLLERVGLRREGHLRQNIYFWNDSHGGPAWQDTYEYGLLASEWRGISPTR